MTDPVYKRCSACGQLGPLEDVRRWPGQPEWVGECEACHNTIGIDPSELEGAMDDRQTELDCGCRIPGGPYCDAYEQLRGAVRRAYSDVLDATDAVIEANDDWAKHEALAALRAAKSDHKDALEALRAHRLGPDVQRPRRGRADGATEREMGTAPSNARNLSPFPS